MSIPQFFKTRESRSGSNRGPSAYQPCVLPLGHTGSLSVKCSCHNYTDKPQWSDHQYLDLIPQPSNYLSPYKRYDGDDDDDDGNDDADADDNEVWSRATKLTIFPSVWLNFAPKMGTWDRYGFVLSTVSLKRACCVMLSMGTLLISSKANSTAPLKYWLPKTAGRPSRMPIIMAFPCALPFVLSSSQVKDLAIFSNCWINQNGVITLRMGWSVRLFPPLWVWDNEIILPGFEWDNFFSPVCTAHSNKRH